VPLLVGGAALSERFTVNKIAPAYGEAVCYAKDAMTGLRLMNQLMDPAERDACSRRIAMPSRARSPSRWKRIRCRSPRAQRRRCVPICRFCPRRISIARCATCRSCRSFWSYINPFMLFGRHLGYKGNFEKDLAKGEAKALELNNMVDDLKREAAVS
jgi:5-methyltetrahydrofolate--homocysteine methyltransferase